MLRKQVTPSYQWIYGVFCARTLKQLSHFHWQHRREEKKMTTTKHNRMKKKNWRKKKSKHQRKLNVPEVERKIEKKTSERANGNDESERGWNNKGKKAMRGMRATIKRRKKKIILNYLCCLVYDACGIRWASSNTVANVSLSSCHANVCKCCKVSDIVSLVSLFSSFFPSIHFAIMCYAQRVWDVAKSNTYDI